MSSKHKCNSVPDEDFTFDIDHDVPLVTESSHTMKTKSPTSHVWDFFKKVEQGQITYLHCKATPQCQTKYKQIGSSTSNMKTHMKTAHHLLWSKVADISGDRLMGRFLKQCQLPQEFNALKFHELLAEWVILEDEPFTATESDSFQRLLWILQPGVHIPSADTIQLDIMKFYEREKDII